jgi:hypothetical protein
MGNDYVSNIVSIVVDGTPTAIILSGDGQSGFVGDPVPAPLVAKLVNTCGAPMANMTVSWSSSGPMLAQSITMTDGTGTTSNTATFGTVAGAHSVIVGGSAEFTLTGTALGASYVELTGGGALMQGVPVDLHFVAVDRYENPVTGTNYKLTVDLKGAPISPLTNVQIGTCASGVTSTTVTSASGAAKVTVCSPGAGDLRFSASSTPLPFRGTVTLLDEDFEASAGQFTSFGGPTPGNPWERGVPSGVAAHSGNHVWGTAVTSGLSSGAFGESDSGTNVDLTDGNLYDLQDASLSFYSYRDMPMSPSSCGRPSGGFFVNGQPQQLPGEQQSFCGWPPFAFLGTSGGWEWESEPLDSWLSMQPSLQWAFYFDGSDLRGAKGWYIDDVKVRGHALYPKVTFGMPGVPYQLFGASWFPGIASCSGPKGGGAIAFAAQDAFGAPVAATGVSVTLSSSTATITSAVILPAQNGVRNLQIAPGGHAATLDLDQNDLGMLDLDDSVAETVHVSLQVNGGPVKTIDRTFQPKGAEVLDGVDDDCDGLVDCEDPDDAVKAECQVANGVGETCNRLNDNADPNGDVDEMACNCVSGILGDDGCDDINTGADGPYVCQDRMSPVVCGYDCRIVDTCASNFLTCDTSDGHCR